MTSNGTQTITQRLAEGPLPVQEALRIAMSLAQALRKIHDEGGVHGALTPGHIGLTAAGVELAPAEPTPHSVTAYTAPEILRGRPADRRSDIFSFGAIVYEMMTGRPPFSSASPEGLADAVLNTPAPATGGRVSEVLLRNCLAKNPTARWQRMQKVQLELRLLAVLTRRTETPLRRGSVAALVRAEVQQVIALQVGTRLEAQDKTIADLQEAVTKSLQTLHAHLSVIDTKVAGAEYAAELLQALEERTRSQAEALEAAYTALAQTDDLVERAVEALDSLQSIVLEDHGLEDQANRSGPIRNENGLTLNAASDRTRTRGR